MKGKLSTESIIKKKNIEEKDKAILYEKLLIIGDKNVGNYL